jgi:Tfp pilus assembly protein PilF
MRNDAIAKLEALRGGLRDGALLRYSLGNEWLKAGDAQTASDYLREAVALDPKFSAAWKLLGKALTAAGQNEAALEAYEAGIQVAEAKGDRQAVKEMGVFARRLRTGDD